MAPDPLKHRLPAWLWAAAALGGMLRLAYLLQFRVRSLFWEVMLLDAEVYHQWAAGIAAGDLLGGDGVYPLPPLYPYLVAILYALAGPAPPVVFLFQSVLGVLNLLLLGRLALHWLGTTGALCTVVLALLYGPLLFLESKLLNGTLTVTLTLLLLTAAWHAAARPHTGRWLLAGVCLAALVLVRPEMVLLAPLLAWWGWNGWRSLAGFTAGLLILLAPVAARNTVQAGLFSPGLLVSSQGALTFYQANNPRAAGLYVSLAREGFSGDPRQQAAETKRLAEQHTGRSLSLAQANRFWLARSWDWISRQPLDFLRLEALKLARFWSSVEYSTEYVYSAERHQVPALWLTPLPFSFIAATGLLGGLVVLRGGRASRHQPPARRGLWLVTAVIGVNLLACMTFYVSTRYRLPATVGLLILGGAFLSHCAGLWQGGPSKRRQAIQQGCAALALAAVLLVPVDRRHVIQEANLHTNRGTLHYDRGERLQALEAYSLAVELEPLMARGHLGRGVALEALGRREQAAGAYRRALALNGRLEAARQGLQRLESSP